MNNLTNLIKIRRALTAIMLAMSLVFVGNFSAHAEEVQEEDLGSVAEVTAQDGVSTQLAMASTNQEATPAEVAKGDFKEGFKGVGRGFKNGTKATGRGFKKAGLWMGRGFKKAGTATGRGFKKVGRFIKNIFTREKSSKDGVEEKELVAEGAPEIDVGNGDLDDVGNDAIEEDVEFDSEDA